MSESTAPGFYESEDLLSQYLLFHYGKQEEILPYPFGPVDAVGFAARCVSDCLSVDKLPPASRALDLGCAVGRSSFELAKYCQEVIGIDASATFIAAANRLKADGELAYRVRIEGDICQPHLAKPPVSVSRDKIQFVHGDALDLPDTLGSFDVVLLANLLDRLPRPRKVLDDLPQLVKRGGQLIIASPYTWLEEFTPREHWLGGFERDGKPVSTFETLQELLGKHFNLTGKQDLPFLIREHARKFQWSVSEATTWERL